MCPVMIAKVVAPVEEFIAFVFRWKDALEWLFSGMNGLMAFKVLFSLEWTMARLSCIVDKFASELLLLLVVHMPNIYSVAMQISSVFFGHLVSVTSS